MGLIELALIPIPFFEQVGNGVLEARQQCFAVEKRSRAEQLTLREGIANLYGFGLRVNNPHELGTAGEKVLQTLVNFHPGIAGGKNFDGQIRSARKEPFFVWLESKRSQPGFGDERNIR